MKVAALKACCSALENVNCASCCSKLALVYSILNGSAGVIGPEFYAEKLESGLFLSDFFCGFPSLSFLNSDDLFPLRETERSCS